MREAEPLASHLLRSPLALFDAPFESTLPPETPAAYAALAAGRNRVETPPLERGEEKLSPGLPPSASSSRACGASREIGVRSARSQRVLSELSTWNERRSEQWALQTPTAMLSVGRGGVLEEARSPRSALGIARSKLLENEAGAVPDLPGVRSALCTARTNVATRREAWEHSDTHEQTGEIGLCPAARGMTPVRSGYERRRMCDAIQQGDTELIPIPPSSSSRPSVVIQEQPRGTRYVEELEQHRRDHFELLERKFQEARQQEQLEELRALLRPPNPTTDAPEADAPVSVTALPVLGNWPPPPPLTLDIAKAAIPASMMSKSMEVLKEAPGQASSATSLPASPPPAYAAACLMTPQCHQGPAASWRARGFGDGIFSTTTRDVNTQSTRSGGAIATGATSRSTRSTTPAIGHSDLTRAMESQWRSVLGSESERSAAQLASDAACAVDRLGRYGIAPHPAPSMLDGTSSLMRRSKHDDGARASVGVVAARVAAVLGSAGNATGAVTSPAVPPREVLRHLERGLGIHEDAVDGPATRLMRESLGVPSTPDPSSVRAPPKIPEAISPVHRIWNGTRLSRAAADGVNTRPWGTSSHSGMPPSAARHPANTPHGARAIGQRAAHCASKDTDTPPDGGMDHVTAIQKWRHRHLEVLDGDDVPSTPGIGASERPKRAACNDISNDDSVVGGAAHCAMTLLSPGWAAGRWAGRASSDGIGGGERRPASQSLAVGERAWWDMRRFDGMDVADSAMGLDGQEHEQGARRTYLSHLRRNGDLKRRRWYKV